MNKNKLLLKQSKLPLPGTLYTYRNATQNVPSVLLGYFGQFIMKCSRVYLAIDDRVKR